MTLSGNEHPRDRDFRDLNLELAGLDAGQIKRFLSPEGKEYLQNQKTGKHKDNLSLLDILLLTDPLYQQKFLELASRIEDIEDLLERHLAQLNTVLEQQEAHLADIRANAYQLPDGSRVYLDTESGAVYREDGSRLSNEEVEQIIWEDGNPSWQAYRSGESAIDDTRRKIGETESYRDDVVTDIKHRMRDHHSPMDHDTLDEVLDQLEREMPSHAVEFERNANASDLSSVFHQRHAGIMPDIVPEALDAEAVTSIPDFTVSEGVTANGLGKPS
ncbi:MAG: hypothetical protein AAF569_00525 [Pseudomonadota bacterium]